MGGSLGKNEYMYMYGWVPLLSTYNYHNSANQLYSNRRYKARKKHGRYSYNENIEFHLTWNLAQDIQEDVI